MKRSVFALIALAVPSLIWGSTLHADVVATGARRDEQRLSFQTSAPWNPRVNLNADVAMVYGIDEGLPQRMASWREHGYRIEVMTGVAWGRYLDYIEGRFDGKPHRDQAQTDAAGNPIMHGNGIYYMSPDDSYGNYLAAGVRRALDAGAEAIYLEEPEYWVRAGWSENFKRQWKAYYGEDWQPPNSSPDAQYRASKLKYFLYRRALSQVFDSVKQWGVEHGKSIPCYVPTHSLINYAQWGIVSPESSLLDVGCDGYIAQVWTGTARTPNVYEGNTKERTFETAFLEYGAMQNLVRASGRRVWYLNDPIEDNPNHSWDDYRKNWESTLAASLLQPEVWRYEIVPWPHRVFTGRYPATQPARPVGAHRQFSGNRIPIPKDYETELQTVFSALGDMKQPRESVKWEIAGTRGVGVLVSDTMMFQRGDPTPSDPHLGSFYGLAMPLLKRGIPVEPVQIESASADKFLDRYKLLLLTYEGQKPPSAKFHEALARWVKQGGALVVVDDDRDPYDAVREWWNTSPLAYTTPRHHLFEVLGLKSDAAGVSRVGKGAVVFASASPAAMTHQKDGANQLRRLCRSAAEPVNLPWSEGNALVLRRGPYLIAAGLDESNSDAPPVLHGRFIPLFDAQLPLVQEFTVTAGSRALLLDVDALSKEKVGVIAAACRVTGQTVTPQTIRFRADGLEASDAIVRLELPKPPTGVTVDGKARPSDAFDYADGSLRLRFANSAAGVTVEISR